MFIPGRIWTYDSRSDAYIQQSYVENFGKHDYVAWCGIFFF